MIKLLSTIAALAVVPLALAPLQAQAFCGFYVGKADSSLFNDSSQVILSRDGQRTTISMRNDYRGAPTEFALVVPVPVVLKKEDVKVLDQKIFNRLDDYSAPRLVEYRDENPCAPPRMADRMMMSAVPAPAPSAAAAGSPPKVKVEAFFTVGEYDIVILSARRVRPRNLAARNGYARPRAQGRVDLRPPEHSLRREGEPGKPKPAAHSVRCTRSTARSSCCPCGWAC